MSATLYGVKMRCVDLSASLLVDQLPVLTGRSRKHTLVRHSQLFTFQRSARLPTMIQRGFRLASSLSFSGEGSIRNPPPAVKPLAATLFVLPRASRCSSEDCAPKMSLQFVKVPQAFHLGPPFDDLIALPFGVSSHFPSLHPIISPYSCLPLSSRA
jgi:hypothetical protein